MNPAKPRDTITRNIRIKKDLAEQVQREAEKHNRSMNGEVVTLLEEALKAREAAKVKQP